MLFYVQQTELYKESSRRRAILDLPTLNDSLQVESLANRNNQGANSNAQASMFRLEYSAQGHGLKEGSWYNLDPKVFDGIKYRSVRASDAGGVFLRGELIAGNNPLDMDLAPPKKAELPVIETPDLGKITGKTLSIKLSVVNCGHGNWNEVLTDDLRLIYDVGACRSYTSAKTRQLVRSRKIAAEQRRVVVFISHWDIDHYQALLKFNRADLAKVSAVYAPSQLPDTATFKRVRDHLSHNQVLFQVLEPEHITSKQRTITLLERSRNGPYRVFRATPGRARNQTGIVIGIEGATQVGLLTGDHHYEKILQAAKVHYCGKPCVLVTPHHGGAAGKVNASNWLGVFTSIQTPISCGQNSYGHPTQEVLDELQKMQGGTAPWRSDMGGQNTWDVIL